MSQINNLEDMGILRIKVAGGVTVRVLYLFARVQAAPRFLGTEFGNKTNS
jgi:hypothetical protein